MLGVVGEEGRGGGGVVVPVLIGRGRAAGHPWFGGSGNGAAVASVTIGIGADPFGPSRPLRGRHTHFTISRNEGIQARRPPLWASDASTGADISGDVNDTVEVFEIIVEPPPASTILTSNRDPGEMLALKAGPAPRPISHRGLTPTSANSSSMASPTDAAHDPPLTPPTNPNHRPHATLTPQTVTLAQGWPHRAGDPRMRESAVAICGRGGLSGSRCRQRDALRRYVDLHCKHAGRRSQN